MKKAALTSVMLLITCISFAQDLYLFFDVNKYELTDDHKLQLNRLLSRKVNIMCIKGFADSTGTAVYNKDLSRKRAEEVFKYLMNNIRVGIIPEYSGEQHSPGKELYFDRRVEVCFEENKPTDNFIIQDSSEAGEKKDSLVPATEKYELSNIHFVPDKAVIESWSFYAVDDAAKYLKRFPDCKFEIVGHVNYVMPRSVANNPKAMEPAQKLSEERAKTVYDLLVEREIPTQRMTHKGVGNTQMIYKNPKSDEEKRKNMRVEILIYCNK